MSTTYAKTDNYNLNLYGNNDPADLRDGYNGSMRTIDTTLEQHLNRIEGVESRETHDEEVVKALLGDNTVDNATAAKAKWDEASIGVSKVTAVLPNYAMTFDTVSAMKNSKSLTDGMKCRTLGFYEINDGGGAYYIINSGENTANGMDAISCQNNLIAKLIVDNNFHNVKQYGAHGDATSDDTEILLYVLQKQRSVTYIPSGQYVCHKSITVGWNTSVIGDELTNSSVNGAGTCLLMYDLPDTDDHAPSALILTTFNTVKNLYIKGNQWDITENRSLLNPSAIDYGGWMTKTAKNDAIKTCGIKSNTVCYMQNVIVERFKTGFNLSSQGNVTQLAARKCVLGYNIYGDMRATSLQASSCMKGFFFGGGNEECMHLRCDGIGEVAYEIYYGGSFVDLSADFVGMQMIKTYRSSSIFSNVRTGRCCVNFAARGDAAIENDIRAYGVQLIEPQGCMISGLLVIGGASVSDSETDPTYELKTRGYGVAISQVTKPSDFTVDCASNAVPYSKVNDYTQDEIQKILFINQYAQEEGKNNTYGRVRFRNSIFQVTKGVVTVK